MSFEDLAALPDGSFVTTGVLTGQITYDGKVLTQGNGQITQAIWR
jgi:hypothetical protein